MGVEVGIVIIVGFVLKHDYGTVEAFSGEVDLIKFIINGL